MSIECDPTGPTRTYEHTHSAVPTKLQCGRCSSSPSSSPSVLPLPVLDDCRGGCAGGGGPWGASGERQSAEPKSVSCGLCVNGVGLSTRCRRRFTYDWVPSTPP